MLIDTHSHLNFSDYDKDRDKVIKKCLNNNVWLINVGTDYETSKKAIEISGKYSQGIFASVGMHPENIGKEIFDYEKYKTLSSSKKVVAIGEIGLDYWYRPKTKKKQAEFKEKQKELLLKQLVLVRELSLPVIFHCRLAHNDLLEILSAKENSNLRGVVHCFTGDWEQTEKYLNMGFYLGFTGIIFKLDLDEIIKKAPLNRILIETDCPFLSPLSDIKRNEPLFVKYIVEKIAKIKNITFKEVEDQTTNNAKKLFNI
jgi:TatD DNase family protein